VTGGQCLEPVEEGSANLVSAKEVVGGRYASLVRQRVIETTSRDVLYATHID
jgi:hypothetical protein